MKRTRLEDRMEKLAAAIAEAPRGDAGNPIWILPKHMIDDDLAGETDDNPLGKLIRDLATTATRQA